ncbi:MAG TPA: flagellar motor protein MotB [Solirubrobacteraceae bacterium]|jgi:chemotaxis protein MotB
MARSHSRGRKRGHGGGEGEESGERWLLTYADMITLLMALFMVLFSISSVNISKVQSLQESLRAAFSGNILPGGKAIAKPGSTANASHAPTATPLQAIVPISPQSVTNPEAPTHSSSSSSTSATAQSASTAVHSASAATNVSAARQEQSNFEHLKHELDAYAAKHGFGQNVHTTIEQRGLVIRVLTDSLLFASGSATLDAQGDPLLSEVADLVNVDHTHPIAVEGNTDDVPVHGGIFPSNWELSTARASTVVRYLIGKGVDPQRLTAIGYASLRPIASNATAAGRALNRRVEIVLQRLY